MDARWFSKKQPETALASFALLVVVAATAILLTGCLSRPPLARQTFMFATPKVDRAATSDAEGLLAVKAPVIAPPFDGKSLVYRTGEDSYEQDPYAEFLVPPSRSLARPIRAYLRKSGAFQEVIEAESALKPDSRVEIHATELYGDFRKTTNAAAVLTLRVIFFEGAPGTAGKPKLQMDCSRRIVLKERTAPALVAGWNKALEQIFGEVTSALKSGSQ